MHKYRHDALENAQLQLKTSFDSGENCEPYIEDSTLHFDYC